jgi:hypothetical protein
MLSHRNIIANIMQLREGWPDYWEPAPTILSFLVRDPGNVWLYSVDLPT